MRIINLRHCQTEQQANEYLGKFLSEANYDQVIEGETTKVFKPDGSVLCILVKGALSKEACLKYYRAVRKKITKTTNRGTASGQKMILKRRKSDGVLKKMTETPVGVSSCVMGFCDGTFTHPFCRVSSFNKQHPQAFKQCLPLIQEVSSAFEAYYPEKFKNQMAFAKKTSPDFVIPKTCFTTVTLNKNFRTAGHKDAGDLPDGFGCITLMRTGKYSGGLLVFPRYYVAVDFDTTDLVLFDPHEVHGNTSVNPLTKEWERITSVFYYREQMIHCGTHEQELLRAQSGVRTKR